MTRRTTGYVPLAAVERNGFDEGLHFGRLLALNAAGDVAFAYGDVAAPMHPRSANKLMQAAGMRSLGLELEGELLALSAASHWGEPKHVDAVRTVLASAGLDESALQTTPALPEDADALSDVVRGDGMARPIFHGCSGKHAAMLATCVVHGWDPATYLDPEHPLQLALRGHVESVIGEPVSHAAVDGCGAPAWAMSLEALVRAYRRAVTPGRPPELGAVADAMRAHPAFVCGERSEVTGLMRAVPGLLVKDGAESAYVAALPDGRAVAIKIADGGFRAGQAVLVAALGALGATSEPGVDVVAFEQWGILPVLAHGEPVGRIRPLIG
ncbi:MAG: asparaginase [Actinomycetia bacterium]|nr:asparaginase [Actinomycetes bacterium]